MDNDPDLEGGNGLFMKILVPAIDDQIGYYTKNLQNILIYDSKHEDPKLPSFFYANTTKGIDWHTLQQP